MWTQLAKSAIKGTAITVGGATVSCCLALYVEKAAHRALFTVCPEKYAEVDQALGIQDWELDAVKRRRTAEATLASELLPLYDEETTITDEVKQTVPPRYGISVSEKNIFTCALTS